MALSTGRRAHRWIGGILVVAILIHVGALWITSPPDVIDALLFVSPTPFSDFAVVAMWAVFGAALLALLRHRRRLRPVTFRVGHTALVVAAVIAGVLHAMLVEGTMEVLSKTALCLLVVAATAVAVAKLKAWKMLGRRSV